VLKELNELVGRTVCQLTAAASILFVSPFCCSGAALLAASFLHDETIITERKTIMIKLDFFFIKWLFGVR
jgi:hypothetical protein